MDIWQLLLFAAASVLALRSLVSLMAHHKQYFRNEMMAREAAALRRPTKKSEQSESGNDQGASGAAA